MESASMHKLLLLFYCFCYSNLIFTITVNLFRDRVALIQFTIVYFMYYKDNILEMLILIDVFRRNDDTKIIKLSALKDIFLKRTILIIMSIFVQKGNKNSRSYMKLSEVNHISYCKMCKCCEIMIMLMKFLIISYKLIKKY